jgi:hypothetical protein
MKYLLAASAYVVSLLLTAIAVSFAVLVLVGPHGGMLPRIFEKPLIIVGWTAVLVLPVLSARWMWRYVNKVARDAATGTSR